MKLSSTITSLVTFFSVVVSAVDVRYDAVYDNPKGSLSTVTCSDGTNGLLTKGFTTFDSLPSFPNIGAAQVVERYNSAACGTCWRITHVGKTINVTAMDTSKDGFVLSLEAMNTLTGGHAKDLGVVGAQATQIANSYCGF